MEKYMQLEYQDSLILIVEDDEVNSKYLERILSKAVGIRIIKAFNGKEAVHFALNNNDIKLIFMDVKMPILDGLSATKEIKKYRPKLPIIAVTAFAMLHDRQNALDEGCDDYISKPYETNSIYAILEKYLTKL